MEVWRGALAIVGMGNAGMLFTCCRSAVAAELTVMAELNGTIVTVSGPLLEGDASHFRHLLEESIAANKPVSTVRLNSSGGNLRESVRIAALIHGAKITTEVTAGAVCTHACFLPFIAGDPKVVNMSATIAGPGTAEKPVPGEAPPIVRGETPALVKVVQQLGLLDAIIGKMLATPENSDFPLSADDLRAMGVMMTRRPSPHP